MDLEFFPGDDDSEIGELARIKHPGNTSVCTVEPAVVGITHRLSNSDAIALLIIWTTSGPDATDEKLVEMFASGSREDGWEVKFVKAFEFAQASPRI